MRRPRLLDLFCGAGGAAMGYHEAGFEVVGVDLHPQPRYPFRFVQADALQFLRACGHLFDAGHASPPCQAHTNMSNRWRGQGTLADERVDLIGATRDALIASGLPYVIENVPGAKAVMRDPIRLTGELFGLAVHRPRLFEVNWLLGQPKLPPKNKRPVAVYGAMDGRLLWKRKDGSELRAPKSLEEPSAAMGIDWMEWHELKEAIPPAYTRWIGERLIQTLDLRIAA